MNNHDEKEVRGLAQTVHGWDFDDPSLLDEPVIKDLRIQVHQLKERIADLEASKVVPWRLVTKCVIGCFLGSVTGMLLAIWLR